MSSHVAQIHVLVIASTHWTSVIASIMRLLSRILVVMVLVLMLVLVMMVAHLTVVVIPHPLLLLLLLLLIVTLVLVLRLVMMSEPRLMIGAYFLSRLHR